MKILIKVTKEILERSAMCGYTPETAFTRSFNCAIALAVRQIFPYAQVGPTHISTGAGNDIELPLSASKFIGRFDFFLPEDRLTMPPISFEIDVPSEVIDKIGIGEACKILSESKTLELVAL